MRIFDDRQRLIMWSMKCQALQVPNLPCAHPQEQKNWGIRCDDSRPRGLAARASRGTVTSLNRKGGPKQWLSRLTYVGWGKLTIMVHIYRSIGFIHSNALLYTPNCKLGKQINGFRLMKIQYWPDLARLWSSYVIKPNDLFLYKLIQWYNLMLWDQVWRMLTGSRVFRNTFGRP